MSDYFQDAAYTDEIRQGDLIRRLTAIHPEGEWGFVLTADCDIVQNKAGDRFTYVEIVPAKPYLERVWAPTQLKRLIERQARMCAEQLSGIMKRSGLGLRMNPDCLITWLQERTPAEIMKKLNRTGKPIDHKLRASLDALRVALDPTLTLDPLQRFCQARKLLGDDVEKIRRSIRDAFEGDRGFPDFFLLPELPRTSGYGFIVMLRAFQSIQAREVFTTETDARIAGRPDAFHRMARLNDRIRFAITQKLAFLFSRIGLPSHYEEACESAVELLAEAAVPSGGMI